jgi:16S rRNA G966 N2-methylase RsmD
VVSEFKAGAAAVEALCRSVADALLVDVERKRLYELPEFESVQAEHHARVRRCASTCV